MTPNMILKGVINLRNLDTIFQELFSLYSLICNDVWILLDFTFNVLSSYLSFLSFYLSILDTCSCDLWYFSYIDLSYSLTYSMDLLIASFSSSSDLCPRIKSMGIDANPYELYRSFTNAPTMMISVTMNLSRGSPCCFVSKIYCFH